MKKAPQKTFNLLVKYFPRLCVDALIVNDKGEYLLGKRNNEPAKGKYYPTGGTMLKKEKFSDSLKRVIKGELGKDIKVGGFKYLGVASLITKKEHDVTLVYRVKYISGKIKLDSQHSVYKWSKTLPSQYSKLIK